MIETMLWNKVSDACKEAGLPIGEEAPDYIVSPVGMTPLGIFQIAHDPPGSAGGDLFDDNSDEDNEDE